MIERLPQYLLARLERACNEQETKITLCTFKFRHYILIAPVMRDPITRSKIYYNPPIKDNQEGEKDKDQTSPYRTPSSAFVAPRYAQSLPILQVISPRNPDLI